MRLRARLVCLTALSLLPLPLLGQAPATPSVALYGSARLRYESWDWFAPAASAPTAPGANSYGYGAGLFKGGLRFDTHRWFDATVEFQNTSLLGLPDDARGPAPIGEMGAGASHFTPHGKQDDTRLFLNQGFITLKRPGRGATYLRAGRFDYLDGAEAVTTDPTLEWLRRSRVAGRLIANFGFSQVQRTFDGASAALDGPRANLTLFAAHPRQGGFELDGWKEMTEVDIAAASLTLKPALLGGKGEARLFAMYYRDRRSPADSVFKVDNRPAPVRNADSADISIPMLGGHYLRHGRLGRGEWDATLWGVYQGGSWGGLDHRAWAYAAEAGYQFTSLPWKPWLRVGYNRSSGDGDGTDGTHRTFFQALTTVRPFAQFPFYNLMNNTDLFGQLILRPVPGRLTLRSDVHSVRLTDARDLWYGGSGAFQRRGSFGFSGRPSSGAHGLATVVDLSADCVIRPWWTATGYVGHGFGGEVVRGVYANDAATLGYLEMTLRRP
jgi:hypothetical protein